MAHPTAKSKKSAPRANSEVKEAPTLRPKVEVRADAAEVAARDLRDARDAAARAKALAELDAKDEALRNPQKVNLANSASASRVVAAEVDYGSLVGSLAPAPAPTAPPAPAATKGAAAAKATPNALASAPALVSASAPALAPAPAANSTEGQAPKRLSKKTTKRSGGKKESKAQDSSRKGAQGPESKLARTTSGLWKLVRDAVRVRPYALHWLMEWRSKRQAVGEPSELEARRVEFEANRGRAQLTPTGPTVVRLKVGSASHVTVVIDTVKRADWSPGKSLRDADRKESRSRLYKSAKPARQKSWRASASAAATLGPALTPILERMEALEPGPSMLAAYKIRAAKRAEFDAWAALNGVGPMSYSHSTITKAPSNAALSHPESSRKAKVLQGVEAGEGKVAKQTSANPQTESGSTNALNSSTKKKQKGAKTARNPLASRRGPVTRGGLALTRRERYWNLDYMPTSPRRLPVLKAATQPGISKSSGELYGSAPQGLADEILEDPLQLVVARILVVDGLQLKLILEAKRKQTSPAEREAALAEALTKLGLFPSSTLDKKADVLRDLMQSMDDAFTAKRNSLGLKLGAALIEKKCKPKELVAEWDKKMKGCINKIDFRMGVRSLGLAANNAEVDALFNEYDDDGGGSLDIPELRSALKSMKVSASKISSEAAAIEEHHLGVKEKLARIEAAILATRNVEQAILAGDSEAAEALRSDAFDQQDVILGEEREQKRLEDEAKAAAEAKEREQREREEAEREAAEREAAAAAEEARKRKEEEAAKLETSDSIEEQIKALTIEAKSLDPDQQEKTLSQVMGAVLVQKNLKPMDLVRAWDQKHKGCVNKIEFRQGVRKGLGLQAENKEIDALFDEFDDDQGGTLDAPELKEALKSMQDAAAQAIANEKAASIKQTRVKERLERIQRILQPTIDAEQALREHSKLMSSVDKAKDKADLAARYSAALELKRVAVREQLAFAQWCEEDAKRGS